MPIMLPSARAAARRCSCASPVYPSICTRLYQNSPANARFSSSQGNKDSDGPAWPTKPNPTPYEIFDIPRSAPYKKHRFYQLVKLYHPDTGSSSSPSTSHDTRLERYRLVVAANDLLSDPAKRKLYDIHGLGWTAGAAPDRHERDRAWRHGPNSPARNANWEDWEAWREAQKNGGAKAEPVYMSNGLFALAVVSACFIGCIVHINRGQALGEEYVQYSAQRNADIGNTMRRSTLASAGRSRDDRIEGFLRERENTAFNYSPKRYDEKKGDETSQGVSEN